MTEKAKLNLSISLFEFVQHGRNAQMAVDDILLRVTPVPSKPRKAGKKRATQKP